MKRYKLIFEQVPYAVALTDNKGNIIGANEAMAKLLGAKTEELPGKNISYFTGKDYLKSLKNQVKQLSSTALTVRVDLRLGKKDGYGEAYFRICRLTEGKEKACLWVEAGLKSKALKFQGMVDNLPAAVMEDGYGGKYNLMPTTGWLNYLVIRNKR
ncbi:MAG: PAS domain S-box protein [Actinomycetota bacterium]|nr:PAS domain S-box protein [Actinomycetota bacterium]